MPEPTVEPLDQELKRNSQAQEDTFTWAICESRAKKTITAWDNRIGVRAQENRNIRKIDVDVQALQDSGDLKVDETIIPIRVVDTNIRQEIPPHLNYVKQSQRLAIFKSLDNPTQNTTILEDDFTTGMKYLGWESWIRKSLDGGILHGWTAVEVEFNENKPLHTAVSYIAHENLIFPLDAQDLQSQPEIFIKYKVTWQKLEDFITDFGFLRAYCEKLIEKAKVQNKNITIYKRLFKFNKEVYVSWMSLEGCEGWLKKPEKLYRGRDRQVAVPPTPQFDPMGIQIASVPREPEWLPITENSYPIHLYRYSETEESELVETEGRAFLDAPVQEAETACYTSFVNAAVRATNVMGSPKNPPGTGGKPTLLDLELLHGKFYSEPMEFFSTPFPTMDLIRGAQSLDTRKQVETGKVAFAAINSKDSRKTAREIDEASDQTQLLSSVQVTDFATFLRSVFNDGWLIIQSQALRNLIKFCQTPQLGEMGQVVGYVNNVEVIAQTYLILPAGDTDVIKRAEKKQKRMEFWPIIAATPLAMEFLLDMLREEFPEDIIRYEQILRNGDPEKNFIGILIPVLQALTVDPCFDPAKQQQFGILLQQATQLVQQPQQQGGQSQQTQAA